MHRQQEVVAASFFRQSFSRYSPVSGFKPLFLLGFRYGSVHSPHLHRSFFGLSVQKSIPNSSSGSPTLLCRLCSHDGNRIALNVLQCLRHLGWPFDSSSLNTYGKEIMATSQRRAGVEYELRESHPLQSRGYPTSF
ncbi:hypothetical protein EmuJ_000053000 [Echinococcus multilocularis]|uniref:Uncharacterized protein n=1 Tax=Echinococcus multilocularis TaxID=6211 RepID=A0A087VWY9_ECHMU|nr:hypothetical protein EmuJ_000053000 [Echinococcus multilocularis]